MKKGGLGKGLDALFTDNSEIKPDTMPEGSLVIMRIGVIEPNSEQPRKHFDDDKLLELSQSIKEHGLIQPIVVRKKGNSYEIVAGERRWRASRMAGLSEVPVVIRDYSDRESMVIAMIENLQREDLNPVEQAEGYEALMRDFNMTQEEIASVTGRSRPAIANMVRILNLPVSVLEQVKKGIISAGHAKAILSVSDKEKMEILAALVEREGLSVRDTEERARKILKELGKNNRKAEDENDSNDDKSSLDMVLLQVKSMESSLEQRLGRKVRIISEGKGKGRLEIDFYDSDDFEKLLHIFGDI